MSSCSTIYSTNVNGIALPYMKKKQIAIIVFVLRRTYTRKLSKVDAYERDVNVFYTLTTRIEISTHDISFKRLSNVRVLYHKSLIKLFIFTSEHCNTARSFCIIT